MRGETAIDPESGAQLSLEREFPFDGSFHRSGEGTYFHNPPEAVSARTPDPDEHAAWDESREGALTTGADTSSPEALTAHFRREADAFDSYELDAIRAASTAFRTVRREAPRALDEFAWYSVAQRLHTKGHHVRWMRDSVLPKCPHCRSACKPSPSGVRCASAPNDHGHVREAIHARVADVYLAAFGEEIDRVTAFDPPEADNV